MSLKNSLNNKEHEALLVMFKPLWQKKFTALDGLNGRPNINFCIDLALKQKRASKSDDLISFIEEFLWRIAKRIKLAI